MTEAMAFCLRLTPLAGLITACVYVAAYRWGHQSLFRGLSPPVVWSSFILAAVSVPQALVLSFLNGLQDFRWRNVVNVLAPLFVVILLACCWRLAVPLSPLVLVWANILSIIIAITVGVAYIASSYRPAISWQLPYGWKQSYVWYGLKSWTAMVAQALNYRLDTLILNVLMGTTAVGLYSTAVPAAELLLFIPNAVSLVLYPKVAASREEDRAGVTILTVGFSLYLVLGGGIILTASLPWLIPHLYGKAFASGARAAQWLIPGMVALTIVKTISSAVAGLGRPEYMTYSILVGLLGTLGLNCVLIPRYGVMGAAWASSGAYWISALAILSLYAGLGKLSPGFVMGRMVVEPAVWLRNRCLSGQMHCASSFARPRSHDEHAA
jgi:O-antigen/teichoic acid export membrane protein